MYPKQLLTGNFSKPAFPITVATPHFPSFCPTITQIRHSPIDSSSDNRHRHTSTGAVSSKAARSIPIFHRVISACFSSRLWIWQQSARFLYIRETFRPPAPIWISSKQWRNARVLYPFPTPTAHNRVRGCLHVIHAIFFLCHCPIPPVSGAYGTIALYDTPIHPQGADSPLGNVYVPCGAHRASFLAAPTDSVLVGAPPPSPHP